MKKLCFITTIPLTLNTFVLNTAKYIHQNTDWDISFICNNEDNFGDSLPDYIHYYPVKMERGISLSGIKSMFKMKKIFKSQKFDLIQYSTPNASLYASMAGKFAKIPVRLYCQWGMAFVGFTGIKRKVFQLEEKYVCSLSTHIEPDSNSNLEFAHKIGLYPKNKGSVIWNGSACGVNLSKFDINKKQAYRIDTRRELGIEDDAFVYGFVGRITKDKGINELFEAFKNIENSKKDTYLIMVGPNEVDSSVNEELYSWAIKNNKIKFVGYSNVVEKYLSAMDCYVLPSYREGFGMGVVEAEAMGVAVIVTDIPGPIDAMINNKTGVIVEKANPKMLETAMKKMYFDNEFCKQCGENGVELAQNNFEQNKLFNFILQDRKNLLRNSDD